MEWNNSKNSVCALKKSKCHFMKDPNQSYFPPIKYVYTLCSNCVERLSEELLYTIKAVCVSAFYFYLINIYVLIFVVAEFDWKAGI